MYLFMYNSMHPVRDKEFKEINGLPTKERVKQRIGTKLGRGLHHAI